MGRFDLSNSDKRFIQAQFSDLKLWVANQISTEEKKLMPVLDDLTAQVKANTDVEASAVLLIQGLAQKLADAIAAGNPAALTALQTELKTSADALAAAVTANTPAA